MKTRNEEKEVVPSFDDLVFENRNKEYGAFVMRKKYNLALLWSILVSIFFISASVITPYIIEKGKPISVITPKEQKGVIFDGMEPPIEIPKIEPPKQDVIKVKQLIYVAPKIVDSVSLEDSKNFLDIDDVKNLVQTNIVDDIKPLIDKVIIEPEINNTINDVFSVNEKPYFGIEGDNEFRGWIAKQIVYPQSCIETNTQGKVYLQFIVEKDGSISNIIILRSMDPELSKEAIRVLGLSPTWNPGKINGTPVRVRINFPIAFTLK